MAIRPLTAFCIALVVSCAPAGHDPEARGSKPDAISTLIEHGEYGEAEETARSYANATRREYGEGSVEMALATELLARALVANGRGASAEALAMAQASLRVREARLGTADPTLIPALRALGDVLRERHDQETAIQVLQRAVALNEQLAIGGLEFSRTLDRAARALSEAGRADDGVTLADRGVRLHGPSDGGRDLARSYEALARALLRGGDYQRAGEIVSLAMELRQGDQSHPEFIETLSLLTYLHWSQGRFEEAHDSAAAAAALAEKTLRVDHPVIAQTLRQLAGARLDLWDIEGARELWTRALATAERALGAAHPLISIYLNDLASSILLVGDYESARRLYDRSLAIAEGHYGPTHDTVATVVYNLAMVDASLGDYERSREEYGRAAKIWGEVRGAEHPFVAQALVAEALVVRDLGRPGEALPLLDRALAIHERSLGPKHRTVAETLTELARTRRELDGDVRQLADRALQIWIDAGSPDDHEHATTLALWAELAAERHDLRAARLAYERSVAIEEQVFGLSHPEVAQVRIGFARTLARSTQRSAAFTDANKAETIGREHLRLLLRSLPERQALNYAAVRPRGLDLMLSLVGSAAGAANIAADAIIRSRAMVLDEMAARRRTTSIAQKAGTAKLLAALASAQQRLANLAVQGPGSMPRERYEQLLDNARRDGEFAERRLADSSAAFRDERSLAQVGLDAVSSALPQDTRLVSFVRYQQLQLPSERAAGSSREAAQRGEETPSYLVVVVSSRGNPLFVSLGSAREIDSLVSKWRSDIAADILAQPTDKRTAAHSYRASGLALRARVWDPIAAHVAGAKTLFVVTDGALGVVPFAALPAGTNGHLIDDSPPIHYLTAERDIVAIGSGRTASSGGLLAFGGPAFDELPSEVQRPGASETASSARAAAPTLRGGASSCGSLRTIQFEQLDGTLQEVQEVAALWPTRLGVPRALIGREASEPAFKRDSQRYRVLHVATHGFFLDGSCLPQSATANTRGVGGLSAATPVENPLRLSGLALAGANRRALVQSDEDDGILTAEEVATLDLQGVEWAVLSACDTGVGEIKAGEGVFGLRRAFQVAGARTVIMSLWSVDDQATRAWMRALYEGRFQRQLSTADAVHQASLSVLRDRRARGQSTHPFFWAAFVAAGDWR
jgi:CHAT domain-containing protein/tetratricopeptide (TPR) repeat protein